jgi:hypothetical protein
MLGPQELAWTLRVEAELDNLRAALAWAVANTDADLALRLVAPLSPVNTTSVGYAAAPWVETVLALDVAAAHPLRCEALIWSAWIVMNAGDVDEALRRTDQALHGAASESISDWSRCQVLRLASGTLALAGRDEEAGTVADHCLTLARSLDADAYIASALTAAATPFLRAGLVDEALVPLNEALTVARRLDNPSTLSQAALVNGMVLSATQPGRAGELLDEALDAAISVGNPHTIGLAIGWSALFPLDEGDWREAARRLYRAVEHYHHIGDSYTCRMIAGGLGPVFAIAGDDEPAAVFWGAQEDVAEPGSLIWDVKFREAEEVLRHRLGDDGFRACVARGLAMSDEELVAFARSEVSRVVMQPESSQIPPGP